MTDWQDYIGRTQTQTDILTPALVRRHRATLDHDPAEASPLPGIHWCLNLPDAATADLGDDGHPRRAGLPAGKASNGRDITGSFLPPIDLPRRMWAASDVTFVAPMAPGATVERVSTIRSITQKTGNSGRLAFVTLDHATSADGVPVVAETQTLVYREASAATPAAAAPRVERASPSPVDWPHTHAVTPTETMLFRFSALTFNTHRIHYDLPYARDVEGYAGLVVHGPLTATLLLDWATGLFGPISQFAFRAAAPAFAGQPLTLVARDDGATITLAALGPKNVTCMTATAMLA